MTTKKDIENYGMDKFTKACKDRVKHFSGIITEQSKRLGQWMDWDHSYYTNTDENIGGIWYFLKEESWMESLDGSSACSGGTVFFMYHRRILIRKR